MLRAYSFRFLAAVLLLCSSVVFAQDSPVPAAAVSAPAPFPKTTYREEAAAGIAKLQESYSQKDGLYLSTTGWWNSANAITMLADYSLAAHTKQFMPVFNNTLAKAQVTPGFPGFLNKYYDDEGWWALAWIAVYDVKHDKRYLQTAESIFADMAASWDDTCDGGIWWSKDRTYKNAIANELFLSVAAHLAVRTKGVERAKYLDWAHREWTWFDHTGMINEDHLVNDGLNLKTCKNNGRKTWSYNQGVILGGLAELNRVAPDPALLKTAQSIAEATFTKLTNADGILIDRCEPKCNADGVQFKGIFIRNLVTLDAVAPHPRYLLFIDVNADLIWSKSQVQDHSFGQSWAGPFDAEHDTNKAGVQSSALDALVAAAQMQARSKH